MAEGKILFFIFLVNVARLVQCIKLKKSERLDKYLAQEPNKMSDMKVIVVPVITGIPGAV